jgi:hypothetical protein
VTAIAPSHPRVALRLAQEPAVAAILGASDTCALVVS